MQCCIAKLVLSAERQLIDIITIISLSICKCSVREATWTRFLLRWLLLKGRLLYWTIRPRFSFTFLCSMIYLAAITVLGRISR